MAAPDGTDVLLALSASGRDDLAAWVDARLKRYEADYDALRNLYHDLERRTKTAP